MDALAVEPLYRYHNDTRPAFRIRPRGALFEILSQDNHRAKEVLPALTNRAVRSWARLCSSIKRVRGLMVFAKMMWEPLLEPPTRFLYQCFRSRWDNVLTSTTVG
jgi:hypothetical protein